MSTDINSENLYPTDLSEKFAARGGSEYHILLAVNEIKDALAGNEAMVEKVDWLVTQLGNLAYTAGIEASETDIDAIVNERIADRDYSDSLYRSYHTED